MNGDPKKNSARRRAGHIVSGGGGAPLIVDSRRRRRARRSKILTVQIYVLHHTVSIMRWLSTLAVTNGKRNITVLRPSIRPSVCLSRRRILNVTHQAAARNAASVHFRPSITMTDILLICGLLLYVIQHFDCVKTLPCETVKMKL